MYTDLMKPAFFLFLAVATLRAADPAPFFDKVTAETYSPKNDVLIEHCFERDGAAQVWLVSTSDPAKRRLLFSHHRHAEVLFSPDENWLVINDHYASNESRLFLYRQRAPLDYERVADLTDAAWQFFDQRNDRKTGNGFDHSYVDAIRWGDDDPPTLLLYLRGHSDSRNNTRDWYCLYDIRTKTFSTDLDAHNQKNTKLEHK